MQNRKYWDDLIAEGRGLTAEAEGEARMLQIPEHAEDRAQFHVVAQGWRDSIKDTRSRDLERPEHQLLNVVDVYRSLHPHADRLIGPRGIPRRRPTD